MHVLPFNDGLIAYFVVAVHGKPQLKLQGINFLRLVLILDISYIIESTILRSWKCPLHIDLSGRHVKQHQVAA